MTFRRAAALLAAICTLASAACGKEANGSAVVATVTPVPTAASPAGASPSVPVSASPTATAAPPTATAGPSGPVLPCGDILVPINKTNRLAADCTPGDLESVGDISDGGGHWLRREAAAALRELFAAAAKDGFRLYVNSGFRDYATQAALFDGYVRTQGLAYAERTSARPGHSEHQLGTTADVGFPGHYLEEFEGTAEARWIAANAWKFGFAVSYPEGKEAVTGYAYEPWHIRYLGKDVARKVHESGRTVGEYLQR